jgi:hypothetical protein
MDEKSGPADARSDAVLDVVRKVRAWNVARDPTFRDLATHVIDDARESFRDGPEGALPAPGEDPRFDALLRLARMVDASPQAVLAALADLERAADQETRPIRPGGA